MFLTKTLFPYSFKKVDIVSKTGCSCNFLQCKMTPILRRHFDKSSVVLFYLLDSPVHFSSAFATLF